jgi:RHH-type proline utilization regulon transcriptional repressor/proline dehydrogenase/delta 1-pyrroline-5-carboxylate dehydrogenase
MLGEGARTAADAERYFAVLCACDRCHRRKIAAGRSLHERPGISVKLSALHPRYEAVSRAGDPNELGPQACWSWRRQGQGAMICRSPSTPRRRTAWSCRSTCIEHVSTAIPRSTAGNGFGLAVQAYPEARTAVIDYGSMRLTRALSRRLMVRLVKGAYWDTEVKRAQERRALPAIRCSPARR